MIEPRPRADVSAHLTEAGLMNVAPPAHGLRIGHIARGARTIPLPAPQSPQYPRCALGPDHKFPMNFGELATSQ